MLEHSTPSTSGLRRKLGLPLLTLYGTGIAVGAGIYVLIGTVAGHAGIYSPWAFLLAAIVMGLTVASYAEAATRYPVSAGEAAYVRAAFKSRALSTAVGLLTLWTGVIASAAVTLGGAGYVRQFIALPSPLIAMSIVVALGLVAAWGILESVVLAGLFTLIETGGLVLIVALAAHSDVSFAPALLSLPPPEPAALSGIAFGSLLAFFAFIGFEGLAKLAEEAKVPHRDVPVAMVLTLLITSILYVLVSAVSIRVVPPDELAASLAPLSLVFQRVAGGSPATLSAIAVVATLNTILAQMTMASRVIYGMARQGDLPHVLGHVHDRTGTPLIATGMVMVMTIACALVFPLEKLAEATSLATLATFALVNLSLLRLRIRKVHSPARHVRVPLWVPAFGFVTCIVMIGTSLLG